MKDIEKQRCFMSNKENKSKPPQNELPVIRKTTSSLWRSCKLKQTQIYKSFEQHLKRFYKVKSIFIENQHVNQISFTTSLCIIFEEINFWSRWAILIIVYFSVSSVKLLRAHGMPKTWGLHPIMNKNKWSSSRYLKHVLLGDSHM